MVRKGQEVGGGVGRGLLALDEDFAPSILKKRTRNAKRCFTHGVYIEVLGCSFIVVAPSSLPPRSILGVPLLFDQPLDLGPQRLQVLLEQRENGDRWMSKCDDN